MHLPCSAVLYVFVWLARIENRVSFKSKYQADTSHQLLPELVNQMLPKAVRPLIVCWQWVKNKRKYHARNSKGNTMDRRLDRCIDWMVLLLLAIRLVSSYRHLLTTNRRKRTVYKIFVASQFVSSVLNSMTSFCFSDLFSIRVIFSVKVNIQLLSITYVLNEPYIVTYQIINSKASLTSHNEHTKSPIHTKSISIVNAETHKILQH